jgi:DNA-binding GntR family transcriptional regulator
MDDAVFNSLDGRPKLGREVTRILRDAIMSGKFAPGQRMMVDELARQLGVSTMPIREALVTLAGEGLVDELARRGFRVTDLQPRDIEATFKVQAFVAGLLAADAAEVIDDQTLASLSVLQDKIEALATEMPAVGVAGQIEELNHQFHSIINHLSDSGRLRWFLRVATRYVPRNFYEDIPEWTRGTVEDHPGIIAALAKHDPALAQQRMTVHTSHAGEYMINYLATRFAEVDRRAV